MKAKSIFASKTFWLNVLGAAAMYSGYLPPKAAAIVMPVANIALRFLTNQPVTLMGSSE